MSRIERTPMVDNGYGGTKPAYRMDAYYYSFEPTGIHAIDMILSAVACAGKAFHHTEQWQDDCAGWYDHLRGETPAEWIQNAAIDAAAALAALDQEG